MSHSGNFPEKHIRPASISPLDSLPMANNATITDASHGRKRAILQEKSYEPTSLGEIYDTAFFSSGRPYLPRLG
jgi:hypothetical protein